MTDVSTPDPRLATALGALHQVELEAIEDREFHERDVYADGRAFVRCRFRGCRIIIELGHCVFSDCDIQHGTFDWRGPALNVVRLVDAGAPTRGSRGR